MTYTELLKKTKTEKGKLKQMENRTEGDFILQSVCKKDIENLPDILACFFLSNLSDNVDTVIDSLDDEYSRQRLTGLYTKYQDHINGDDVDLTFDDLPEEAVYD